MVAKLLLARSWAEQGLIGPLTLGANAEEWTKAFKAAAQELLADAQVPCRLHLVTGDPASTIAKFAAKLKCDLIVMGTRGTGTVRGLVFGSVATKVVHLADTPVTLVK